MFVFSSMFRYFYIINIQEYVICNSKISWWYILLA